jgi:hypothetical protein
MSLDFSSHRRKRSFPYSLFGFATVISAALLLYLFFSKNGTIDRLITLDFNEVEMTYLGFSMIVLGFTSFMLSLGTIANIKADFRIFLHLTRTLSFFGIALAGYFLKTPEFPLLAKICIIASLVYHIFLIFFFFNQKKGVSSYGSRIMMAVSVFPTIPLTYSIIRVFSVGFENLLTSTTGLDYYAKLLLFITIFIKNRIIWVVGLRVTRVISSTSYHDIDLHVQYCYVTNQWKSKKL